MLKLRRNIVVAFLLLSCTAASGSERVTYSKDIAQIFQDHCVSCHRPGQVGEMPLRSYEEVRPWSKSILRQVVSREMPPFKAAGPIGRYVDDPRLTQDQIATIQRWIKAGAPRGNPDLLPPPRRFSSQKWKLGVPDLVLRMPKVKVRQDDKDDNITMYSPYVFPHDTWVRATDLHTGHPTLLHHANVMVAPPNDEVPDGLVTRKLMGAEIVHRTMLFPWLPGKKVRLFEGEAIRIEKNSRIFSQTHYAPTTELAFDEMEVGLYFADGVIDPNARKAFGSLLTDFTIPPHDPHYESRGFDVFPMDGEITDFGFHMHVRGKSGKMIFHSPDGTSDTVFEVPKWDFYWQDDYILAEPIAMKAGTKVEFIAVWDNSVDNPDNPDPDQTVRWGARTKDEMYSGLVHYRPRETDPAQFIRVVRGREVGPASATVAEAR